MDTWQQNDYMLKPKILKPGFKRKWYFYKEANICFLIKQRLRAGRRVNSGHGKWFKGVHFSPGHWYSKRTGSAHWCKQHLDTKLRKRAFKFFSYCICQVTPSQFVILLELTLGELVIGVWSQLLCFFFCLFIQYIKTEWYCFILPYSCSTRKAVAS